MTKGRCASRLFITTAASSNVTMLPDASAALLGIPTACRSEGERRTSDAGADNQHTLAHRLLGRDHKHPIVTDAHRVHPDPALVPQPKSCAKLIDPVMQRTNHRSTIDQSVTERTPTMRTMGLRREHLPGPGMKHCHGKRACHELPPLAGWDLAKAPHRDLGRLRHRQTFSATREVNWFGVAGASRSSHGSRTADLASAIAASRSAQIPSASSTITDLILASPIRSMNV